MLGVTSALVNGEIRLCFSVFDDASATVNLVQCHMTNEIMVIGGV